MPLAHHMTVHFFLFQELGHVRQIMRFKSLVHVCGILFQPTWDRPNHWTFSRVNLKLTCSINGFAYVCLYIICFAFCLYLHLYLFFCSALWCLLGRFVNAVLYCIVLYCISQSEALHGYHGNQNQTMYRFWIFGIWAFIWYITLHNWVLASGWKRLAKIWAPNTRPPLSFNCRSGLLFINGDILRTCSSHPSLMTRSV